MSAGTPQREERVLTASISTRTVLGPFMRFLAYNSRLVGVASTKQFHRM
jgi:hypothetical protein